MTDSLIQKSGNMSLPQHIIAAENTKDNRGYLSENQKIMSRKKLKNSLINRRKAIQDCKSLIIQQNEKFHREIIDENLILNQVIVPLKEKGWIIRSGLEDDVFAIDYAQSSHGMAKVRLANLDRNDTRKSFQLEIPSKHNEARNICVKIVRFDKLNARENFDFPSLNMLEEEEAESVLDFNDALEIEPILSQARESSVQHNIFQTFVDDVELLKKKVGKDKQVFWISASRFYDYGIEFPVGPRVSLIVFLSPTKYASEIADSENDLLHRLLNKYGHSLDDRSRFSSAASSVDPQFHPHLRPFLNKSLREKFESKSSQNIDSILFQWIRKWLPEISL